MPDREMVTSATPVAEMELLLEEPPGPWPEGWHTWENTKEAVRRRVADRARRPIDAPKGQGDGIVTAGGGTKYFPSLFVLIGRLRALGCRLPVEVWHLGIGEMDRRMAGLLESFGDVRVVDAEAVRAHHPVRILNGYELKPFALLHSEFSRLIFLDADSVPNRNPTFLFDTDEFRDTGAIFWPDYPRWILPPAFYRRFGMKNASINYQANDYLVMGRKMPLGLDAPVESGQIVVDRKRHLPLLAAAMAWCEFSDACSGPVGSDRMLGDKEAWHVAWHRAGLKYSMPWFWPDWDVHTIVQHDFDGYPLFYHRTQDKWKIDGSNRIGMTPKVPDEQHMVKLVKQLASLWSGRVWDNQTPTATEAALAKRLARTYRYVREGHDERIVEFLNGQPAGGTIGVGKADKEARWSVHGEQIALCGDDGLTAMLRPVGDGFEGRWVRHEKMPVRLVRE